MAQVAKVVFFYEINKNLLRISQMKYSELFDD